MLEAIIWGLIQGLTEFLPISSSGHLVLVPAFLSELGFDVSAPSLGISAVLHLGTLLAVLIYFRADIANVLRFRTSQEGRVIAKLVAIGTIPAVIGLPLESTLDGLENSPAIVGWALVATGVALVIGQRLATGERALIQGKAMDAVVVGIAQAFALIPGISRSGFTISAGNARRFDPLEAARFSFLLGIPAIAGAGLFSLPDVVAGNQLGAELIVGFLFAAISGYAAIALLFAALRRIGLIPFAIYCFVIGSLAVIVF